MKKTSQTSRLFNKVEAKIDPVFKTADGAYILECFNNGKNHYLRSDRLENSSFDISWIDEIEKCLPDLAFIVANPKETTKTVATLAPIELAKKTNAESVRHLASHTHYIKEVNEHGEVIPAKVLNIANESEIHTYENRFIATLIRKLVLFIEKRYEFIQKFAVLHDEEVLYFKSKTTIDGAEVEVETKVKVKSESESKGADISNKYAKRVSQIREYVLYFYKSPLMKSLKTEKNVKSPILMTNIIRKNLRYHHCYELYRFIEKYDALGVSYRVDENLQDFDEQEMKQMSKIMAANYLALKAKDKTKYLKQASKTYKPRVLTSLDDEPFVYGSLLSGPVEFLRVDQGYLDYIDSLNKVVEQVPEHPNKQEKEYYKDELEAKKKADKEKAELDKLARRKKKEAADFEKKAKAIIAQREKEEALKRQKEAEMKKLEEEKKIEAMRQSLISDAEKIKKEQQKEKPVEKAEPKEEKSEEKEQPVKDEWRN